jgi:predicted phage-related endonuclease
MIIEQSFKQHDPEWFDAKLDSIGGTRTKNYITSTGKPSKSKIKYLYKKASEHITRRTKPIYPSYDMKWGTEFEPEAREVFSMVHGVEIEECAMIFDTDKRRSHVSPDGFNQKVKFGLEIKCPMLETHDGYLKEPELPIEYILQVQKGLAITGWNRWWFMSYFPGVEPLFIPIDRDEVLIKKIKIETILFLNDLDKLITRLKG